ncbi:hypothetical protein MTO96_006918 [Rhipicephalus appendiculatus]
MSSEHFKQLDAEARQRYRQKLMFESQELPDPLDADVVRFSVSSGCKNIPPVSAAGIFVYLVEGVCFYTKEQFRSFKLSDAYNSFVDGKVKRVSSFKAGKRGEGVVLIVASVLECSLGDGRSARNTAKFGNFSAVRRSKRTQTEENTGKPEAVLGRAAAASDTAVADPGG